VDVGDCVFSGKPTVPGAPWPPETPNGVESERVADMYEQANDWVDIDHPTPSVRVETNPGPDGSVCCRTVDDTKVKQRLIRTYCVKTFLRAHRKLSWKKVTAGVVVVGAVAATAPIMFPVHLIAAAAVTAISAGGTSTSVAGGAVLAVLNPTKVRRVPGSEQKVVYPCLEKTVRDRPPVVGPWRPCRATDDTHRECAQHG
jgi:hypothetical protein